MNDQAERAHCPVCAQRLPDPLPPFCGRCAWELQVWLEELPAPIKESYPQRLALHTSIWQHAVVGMKVTELTKLEAQKPLVSAGQEPTLAMTLAELDSGREFVRNSFETVAEFRARLEKRGFLPAGQASAMRERYDHASGHLPLQVTLEKWLRHLGALPFDKGKLAITVQRELARAVCQAGEKHRLEASLSVWAGVPYLTTLRLHTPVGLFTLVENSIGSWLVASASSDGMVRLWETASGQQLRILRGHTRGVRSVAFSPDGALVASASSDGTVRLWETASGRQLRTLRGHTRGVRSVAFSPDGALVASASNDQTVRLWETASGQQLRTLRGHTRGVHSVAFSPDGALVASASADQTVCLWETASSQQLRTLRAHTREVHSVVFSPDGALVASASDDRTVRLWETASGEQLRTLHGHEGCVWSVAFSPDGALVASASDDRTVRLWETAGGQQLRTLSGHTDWVWSVAFSPDGALVAWASTYQTVSLWDTASGRQLRSLSGNEGQVLSVAFAPNREP